MKTLETLYFTANGINLLYIINLYILNINIFWFVPNKSFL